MMIVSNRLEVSVKNKLRKRELWNNLLRVSLSLKSLLVFVIVPIVKSGLCVTSNHWTLGHRKSKRTAPVRPERSIVAVVVSEPLRQSAGNISTGNICVIVTVAIINTITQLIFVIYILDVSGCYVMVG